jgi:hypothetical protein
LPAAGRLVRSGSILRALASEMRRHVLGLIAWVVWPAASVLAGMSYWPLASRAALFWAGTLLPAVVLTTYQAGSEGRFSGRGRVLGIFAFAGVIAFAGIMFLGRYWNFFTLDTPVSGLSLIILFYPALFLAGAGAGVLVRGAVTRRTGRSGVALASALATVAVSIGLFLTYEVWESAARRSGEGDGALSPFFASLVQEFR